MISILPTLQTWLMDGSKNVISWEIFKNSRRNANAVWTSLSGYTWLWLVLHSPRTDTHIQIFEFSSFLIIWTLNCSLLNWANSPERSIQRISWLGKMGLHLSFFVGNKIVVSLTFYISDCCKLAVCCYFLSLLCLFRSCSSLFCGGEFHLFWYLTRER